MKPTRPTTAPTHAPTFLPGTPTPEPTAAPTQYPTIAPTKSSSPTIYPTNTLTPPPSMDPSSQPTGEPTNQPTSQPSRIPTNQPSNNPTSIPSCQPSSHPSSVPSSQPSSIPTLIPTLSPSNAIHLSILGNQNRSVIRSKNLVLYSYVFSVNVNDEYLLYLDLSWKVLLNGIEDFSLKSISTDPSIFKLNPYSLISNNQYEIILTVINKASLQVMTTIMTITVVKPSIEAIIKGGIQQSIKVNELILIDASYSYDKDIDGGITGMKSGLSFNWTCVTIKPFYSSNCPLNINPSSLLLDVLELSSAVLSVNTTAKITVTVSDSTRSSNTFIELTILNNDAPIVQITSSFLESINSKNNLVLNANVESKDNSCNAIWTIDDESIPQSKALTPTLTEIPIGNVYLLTFIIAANQLPERNSYKITLHCSDSFSSIIVATNGPPMNGTFSDMIKI
jgi:hypothetical protein